MQVFRLFGMPDSVIAFDSLPERLLQGFEMMPADGFPRHWKEFLGKTKKITKIRPEKDAITGQMRTFDPIVEEGYYFYAMDYMINPVLERWKEVCDFVRANVSADTRLKEKIDEMALPLAPDKISQISLEPEDVPIIKIPLDRQELKAELILPPAGAAEQKSPPVTYAAARCTAEGCPAVFEGKNSKAALRMHTMKRHPTPKPVTV